MNSNAPRLTVRTSNPTGEADVVVQGPNNELIYYFATPGSDWTYSFIAPAKTTYSRPDIVVRDNGECDVVAVGPNNSLLYYHATPGSGWSSSVIAPPNTAYSDPRLVVGSNGIVDVVVQGPGNQLLLFTASPGAAWSQHVVAPAGSTYSTPAIALLGDGSEIIAAQGPSNQLIYYTVHRGSVWSAGKPLIALTFVPTIVGASGSTFSEPDMAVRSINPAGEVDIVALGANGQLMYYYLPPNGSWTTSVIAPAGTAFSAPALVVRTDNPAGETDVVVQGPNNQMLYFNAMPGAAWTKAVIAAAGSALSAPAIFVRSNGEADVVYQGPNNIITYSHATPGSSWTSSPLSLQTSPPVPTSRSWGDYVSFSGGTALGGNVTIKIDNKGTFWFSGEMHDSGAAGYSFTLVMVIVTPEGDSYAFGTSGQTSGNAPWPFSSGPTTYTWNGTPTSAFKDENGNSLPNPNSTMAANWESIVQGTLSWNITAQNLAASALRDFIGDTVKKALQDLIEKQLEGAANAVVALL